MEKINIRRIVKKRTKPDQKHALREPENGGKSDRYRRDERDDTLGAMRAFYTDTSTTTDDTHLTAKTTLERINGLATEFTTPEAPDKKTTQTKAHERYYDPDAAREYVPSTAPKPDEYFIYCNRSSETLFDAQVDSKIHLRPCINTTAERCETYRRGHPRSFFKQKPLQVGIFL